MKTTVLFAVLALFVISTIHPALAADAAAKVTAEKTKPINPA